MQRESVKSRLKRRIRIPTHRHKIESSDWNKISQFFVHEFHDVYGKSCGWQWAIYSANSSFSIDVDQDIVSIHLHVSEAGTHKHSYVEVYSTSEEALIKILMFIDQISEEVGMKIEASKALPKLFETIEEQRSIIQNSKFPKWKAEIIEHDELTDALVKVYGAEHQVLVENASKEILLSILTISWLYGVRFVSISDQDLICFEDAKIKDSFSNWKKPTAWSIARKLGMLAGNGAQAQINLYNCLVKEHWGTYDIRDGVMNKVASHIPLREMHSDWINKTFEDTHLTLENWLLKCGAKAL